MQPQIFGPMVTALDRFHSIILDYWAAVAYLEVTPGGLLGPPPLGGSGGMHAPLEILRNIGVPMHSRGS